MRLLLLLLALLLPGFASAQVSRGVTQTVDPSYTNATDHPLRLDAAGKLYITGTVSVSGAGDATAANQVTGNASLSVIDDWDDGADSATVVPKPTATAAYALTPVVSTLAEANHVLKAGAGNLYGISITTGATAGYVLVFNATSAPADGAVTPLFCYVVPASSSLGVAFQTPAAFSTGITASFSSTGCFTKTASATAFIAGSVK